MLLWELTFSFEPGAVSAIVGEGMLIIGWVAMWRPLEIFLYEAAHRIAWAAVKRSYVKLGNDWVARR